VDGTHELPGNVAALRSHRVHLTVCSNAYAERFVRSIKHECLRHIVPLGERHLRAIVHEFVEHYHAERNHQGLGNVIPFPSRGSVTAIGRIERRQRLGGLLHFYDRKAA
jgi:putative transposase